KLLKVTGITKGTVLLTGGLALDEGLLAALQEELGNEKIAGLTAVSHPDSIYAGAIGAALWGAFPHRQLAEIPQRLAAQGQVKEESRGTDHQRSLHAVRRLRAGVPERGDQGGRSGLCDRSAPLHRVRRREGRAAVQAGVPVRLHRAAPGFRRDARAARGEVRR